MAYQTPEQIAGARLIRLGFILTNRTILQYSFKDKEGCNFNAMADFYHPKLDLYVEIKCEHLNARTSKSKAEIAFNLIDPARRFGKNAAYHQIQNQWNHSAYKQAIVQSTIGKPQFAIVFTKHPDEATLARIVKQGIQAFSLAQFVIRIELQLASGSRDV